MNDSGDNTDLDDAFRDQALTAWGVESEEDPEACHICADAFCHDNDEILFCETCGVAVHQTCYGVSELPPQGVDWFCERCLAEGDGKTGKDWRPKMKTFRENWCKKGRKPSQYWDCALCPTEGGAFTPADVEKKTWVHTVCAFFVPEVGFTHTGKLPAHGYVTDDPINQKPGISKLSGSVAKEEFIRFQPSSSVPKKELEENKGTLAGRHSLLECCRCHVNHGCAVQCQADEKLYDKKCRPCDLCDYSIHVLCARDWKPTPSEVKRNPALSQHTLYNLGEFAGCGNTR